MFASPPRNGAFIAFHSPCPVFSPSGTVRCHRATVSPRRPGQSSSRTRALDDRELMRDIAHTTDAGSCLRCVPRNLSSPPHRIFWIVRSRKSSRISMPWIVRQHGRTPDTSGDPGGSLTICTPERCRPGTPTPSASIDAPVRIAPGSAPCLSNNPLATARSPPSPAP